MSKRLVSLVGIVAFGFVSLQAGQSAPPTRDRLHAGTARPVNGKTAAAPSPDRALLDRYCIACHNDKLKTSGLTLEAVDLMQVADHAEILEKVARKLGTGQMPPPGRPRPDKPVAEDFVKALELALDSAAAKSPNPGRLTAHRLTRYEYANVIHDLLGLDVDAAALLPADNGGVGFDNNADVLSVTPALMNRYISAATKISRLAIGDPTIRPTIQVYKAPVWGTQTVRMNEDLPFGTHGGLVARHTFPLEGTYHIKLRLERSVDGGWVHGIDDEHEIELRVDDVLVKRFKVGGKYKGMDPGIALAIPEDDIEGQTLHAYRMEVDKDLQLDMVVKAGPRLVTAAFVDHRPSESEMIPKAARSIKGSIDDVVRPPAIGSIEISDPLRGQTPQDTPSRRLIFVCRPVSARDEDQCARKILGGLARRAYRRPVSQTDLQEMMELYSLGRREGDFDAGIGRALEGLLAMPAFLFRVEPVAVDAKPGMVYRVSDVELASRLSFFLWKSIPDEELLEIAVRGRLKDPAVLAQQVRRMLADTKSNRWMNDFQGQWLTTRNLQAQEPDPYKFPDFDDDLRDAMLKETELFFQSQVREDRPLMDLLRADYTFLNEPLARHYGITNVYGNHFRRVPVTDPARQGLLGHASVLTVTSYAHRTSVVLRGKWVLETLLGTPPPPPPPNVPPLKENDGASVPKSLRERMENHRSNPVCASCHSKMDPLGFALENFDATGRWRANDEGAPVDAKSTLADGTRIDSPKAFREVLLSRGDQFIRTVTEKVLAYALGRSIEYYDAPTVRQIVRQNADNGNRWSSLIISIVSSQPFQESRVPGPNAAPPVTRVAGAQ
jgi:hypothetical protein